MAVFIAGHVLLFCQALVFRWFNPSDHHIHYYILNGFQLNSGSNILKRQLQVVHAALLVLLDLPTFLEMSCFATVVGLATVVDSTTYFGTSLVVEVFDDSWIAADDSKSMKFDNLLRS